MNHKILSKRTGQLSQKWEKLVYSNASLLNPTKETKKHLYKLWLEGYGHKDAAEKITEFVHESYR